MKDVRPTISLEVDLRNPGQFLSCCGLLELANKIDTEARGWFIDDEFHLLVDEANFLQSILDCDIAPVTSTAVNGEMDNGKEEKSPAIRVGSPFNLTLDWWEDPSATRSGFKTWSGGQTIMGFVNGMRSHVRKRVALDRQLLAALPVDDPKPFYFDSRLSRMTSLDMGFSAEKFTPTFSPAVEFLAVVGLQRFRPQTVEERERYAYASWNQPLPATIAAAVAHGLVPSLTDRRFVFPLVVRTGGKYKAFGPAQFERSSNV